MLNIYPSCGRNLVSVIWNILVFTLLWNNSQLNYKEMTKFRMWKDSWNFYVIITDLNVSSKMTIKRMSEFLLLSIYGFAEKFLPINYVWQCLHEVLVAQLYHRLQPHGL